MHKRLRLLSVLALFAVSARLSCAESLTFSLSNVLSGPFTGPWMFAMSEQPFIMSSNPAENIFAYSMIIYNTSTANSYPSPYGPLHFPVTTSVCTREDSSVVTGTTGLDFRFGWHTGTMPYVADFFLAAFQHRNTVNPAAPWHTLWQSGDFREYAGGTCDVCSNGVVKLRLKNCVFEMEVPYPGKAGNGGPIRASGWGMIDTNQSDAAWAHAFDSGNGRVNIAFESFSSVVQGYYGLFNALLTIAPSPYASSVVVTNVPSSGSNRVDCSEAGVVLDVTTNAPGGADANLRGLIVQRDRQDPTDSLPGKIYYVPNMDCWHIQSSLNSFDMNVRFDVSNMSAAVVSRLVAFGRDSAKQFTNTSPWTLLGPLQFSAPNTVVLTNVTRSGQFVLAATYDLSAVAFTPESLALTWGEVQHATNYWVYGSTNLAMPFAQWTREGATGTSRSFMITNSPSRFFRVEADR